MDVEFSTLLVNSLTQVVQMVLLSRMVLSRKWTGTNSTIVKFTWISFMTVVVDTSDHVYDDFCKMLTVYFSWMVTESACNICSHQ
jgi:hypothetical protein